MIRRSFAMFTALTLAVMSPAVTASAQSRDPSPQYPGDQDRYSADQLDNLVGSIALYPDALLAQVLVAATFPDQIEDAARFVRANGTSDIDDQSWDVSVKAVAHYPSALNMMADKSDWTTTLGRAYAMQSSEVMAAVQRMRAMADHQGNLRTTPQQTVTRDDDDYVIAPAQDRVIYVPVYDPYAIYTRPIFGLGYYGSFWSWGVGFPIGGWLSYDCNWRSRAVYYNGWDRQYYGYAGGWRARSAPYIHITNVYENPRYRNVYINRDVIRRSVEYRNVDRYQGVHRDTRFGGRDVDYRDGRDQVRNSPDRSRYENIPDRTRDERRGGEYRGGTYSGPTNRTDPRGSWNRDDNRGSQNRDENRDANRNDNRGGWNRDNNRGNGNRDQQQQQEQPRRDPRPDMGGQPQRGGDNSRDGRGSTGEVARSPWGRNEAPMVNPRRAESQPQGQAVARSPWGRNEAPMVNPRRAESQPQAQAPQNNGGGQSGGGQRGGSRGGDRQGGHERPKF